MQSLLMLTQRYIREGYSEVHATGFPCVLCLSMKHVADGRRGFFLLHRICMCWGFLSDCKGTFHLQAQ